jgi:hypothetical protein
MNDDDGTIISDTTIEESIMYTHTFPFARPSEQPPVIIECIPTIPKLKGILWKNQKVFVETSLINDVWCNDCPVKRIKLVDVLDTVNKPIRTTQCQCGAAWVSFINIPRSICKHQGYLFSRHVHHRRGIPVECDTVLQWNWSRTQTRVVNKLILVRSLIECPEKLLVELPTRTFIKAIDKHIDYNYLHNVIDGSRGKHVYWEGYSCLTRYPIKRNTVRVNQVTGHVQFGDITVYKSSYEDFLPITDSLVKPLKKKLNVPFTVSQYQSYYFRVQWISSTCFRLMDGKQSSEFLDNNILIPWWNGHMYHNEVDWLKIRKNLKFAQFPLDIIPFPDHPFAVNCDYPRLFCKFPRQNLYKINGYNILVGHWSTLLTWDWSKQDLLRSHRFIYKQLFKRWVHLPHTGHFIQPYKVHSLPVSIIQRRKQRCVRRFLQKLVKPNQLG